MLKTLQIDFLTAAFDKDFNVDNFIKSTQPNERFNVYRQTILENLRNSLAITFPGVWKLLGDECGDSLAYAFCHQHENLPKTGCLDDWGIQFPGFLASIKQLSSVPYIRDYAQYEWLKHKAYGARYEKMLHISSLQNIPENKIDNVVFTFIPSFSIFESSHPIDEVQQALTGGNKEVNLQNKKSYALILRSENEVVTLWVEHTLWTFIASLYRGSTLQKAAQHALAITSDFNLAEAIQFLITKNLTYALHIDGEK